MLMKNSILNTVAAGAQKSVQRLLVALLMVCLGAATAIGQTSQGSISGDVHDATNGRVRSAEVVVTNVDTGVQYKTVTNGAGQYNVQSLNAGTYRVEVTAAGFKKTTVNDIIVSAAQIVETNVELSVGSQNASVTVTAQSDLLSTTSDVATVVDHVIVENLAVSGAFVPGGGDSGPGY